MKWEYATLSWNSVPTSRTGEKWFWESTGWLVIAGFYVAKWTHRYFEDEDQPIGSSLRARTPDPANVAPWDVETADVLSLIGAHGWELVQVTPTWTFLTQFKTSDFQTSASRPSAWDYVFKRPKGT